MLNVTGRETQQVHRTMRRCGEVPRRAFTLLEVLVVVTVIVVIASMVLPALSDENRPRLMAASAILTSDIETAQAMSIANPTAPLTVRFDPTGNRWWIAVATIPNTPITRDDTHEQFLVTLGSGR